MQIGTISFKPDIAQNAVLDQLWNGQSLQPGVKLAKGSTIDLLVGDGSGGALVPIPNLTGLLAQDATKLIESSLLTLGTVVYDGPAKDSLRAVVKRQNPPFKEGETMRSGEIVDLFMAIP